MTYVEEQKFIHLCVRAWIVDEIIRPSIPSSVSPVALGHGPDFWTCVQLRLQIMNRNIFSSSVRFGCNSSISSGLLCPPGQKSVILSTWPTGKCDGEWPCGWAHPFVCKLCYGWTHPSPPSSIISEYRDMTGLLDLCAIKTWDYEGGIYERNLNDEAVDDLIQLIHYSVSSV